MSLITTVIDDKSPLISYDATWLPGTAANDGSATDYYLGTFQKNNAADGTATFTFNGTTVWIFGANRGNHGIYSVQVDGGSQASFNGSGNAFQQVLFSTTVSQGKHTLTLTNTDGASGLYVDIDMIAWQSEVGSGAELVPELVQDWDSRFQYQSQAWQTTSPSNGNLNLNLFNNGTGHVTETSNAAVSFTFSGMFIVSHTNMLQLTILAGEAVTIFGAAGPSSGPYSVQLDGGSSVQYNASNAYPTSYGTTIYHADNLGSGTHQVVLTNLPDQSGQYLSIDHAQLWTVANSSLAANTTICPPLPSSNSKSSQSLNSAAIAGMAVEGAIAIVAAAAALFFYLRWKAALANSGKFYDSWSQSPETRTMTASGIAPSLDAWSDRNSRRHISFQPVANVGMPHQRSNSGDVLPINMVGSGSFNSNIETEEANYGAFQSEGQGLGPRPLPDAPGEQVSQTNVRDSANAQRWSSFGGTAETSPPPGYDTAVRVIDT